MVFVGTVYTAYTQEYLLLFWVILMFRYCFSHAIYLFFFLRIFIQEQSLFPHLFLSLHKYPSIFAFQFCSTVLYFLGYFCSESYILLLLCKLYTFTNYNLHLWPPCKVFTDYVYIGYKPNTLVNILLHSNNLQIFWGISFF